MKRLFQGVVVLTLAVAPAFSASILFEGTFSADNTVTLFNFTALIPEVVTFQTFNYAGGSIGSTTVPAGGFAPVAYLFDNAGTVITLNNGSCGQVGQDPNTLNCDDIFYQNTFGPGSFTLALAVADNRPAGSFVEDGFVEDGNPGFTCQEASTTGSFCDLTTALGTSRTGNFAISFTGADTVFEVGTPEPGSWLLLLAGGAFLALLQRRRCSDPR